MELIDWGKVLGAIVAGALIVYGAWAILILAVALLRGSAGSTHTPEQTDTVLQRHEHPHRVTAPPATLPKARDDQTVPEQSA